MLVPEWRFFAPQPAQGDYHLLYRDRYHDGSLTNWTEVRPTMERRWWNVAWNPGKRERKAVFDAFTEFTPYLSRTDTTLECSVAYLTVLNHVSSIPRSTSPEFTQFLLMASHGGSPEKDPDIIYISHIHSL